MSGTFAYNAAGAMTTRNGTALGYDPMQRLTTYTGVETYTLSTSNQRLVRQAGTTRTLYLPGMEVAVTGAVRTITNYLTIGATHVATKTTVDGGTPTVAWNCASMQNSTVCQAPAPTGTGTQPIPARKRYLPYGTPRNAVTFPGTDHGYLNQPTDTTGLTYLNNRYYDPQTGVFLSVDPLVGKTGTPYLYANGSPATLADPNGLKAAACEMTDSCIGGQNTDWGEQYTSDMNCILNGGCGSDDLAAAMGRRKNDNIAAGVIFAAIESADTGGKTDGNWGAKSIGKAAEGGQNLRDVLRSLGVSDDVIEPFLVASQSVAKQLVGHKSSYEAVDREVEDCLMCWRHVGNIAKGALDNSFVRGLLVVAAVALCPPPATFGCALAVGAVVGGVLGAANERVNNKQGGSEANFALGAIEGGTSATGALLWGVASGPAGPTISSFSKWATQSVPGTIIVASVWRRLVG